MIKTQFKAPKGYFLPFTVSLWHKGVYDRLFPSMEATYQPIRAQYLEDLDQ